MTIRYHCLYIFCLSICLSNVSAQSIRFNEVQASNTVYQDEDGDTPDWIELYNLSNEAIDLNGWSLTDDLTRDSFWTFENTIIDTGVYGALWASGKNRLNAY